MYYELYIDIFFIVNIIIDYIVLSVLKKVLNLEGGKIRRIAAAVMGSALLCLYLVTDLRFFKPAYLFVYIITGVIMIFISFKIVSVYGFIKVIISFYIISFCLNGIFNQLIYGIDYFWQILMWTIFIYIIFCGVRAMFNLNKRREKTLCEVKIVIGNNEVKTSGIWDTGNCLISPYHNRGVSIIEYEICKPYFNDDIKYNIEILSGKRNRDKDIENKNCDNYSTRVFAVPYKTISSSDGILPVIQVERLCIKKGGENIEYNKALIGIVDGTLSQKGDYHMILTTKK